MTTEPAYPEGFPELALPRYLGEKARRQRAEGSLTEALLLVNAPCEVIEEQRAAIVQREQLLAALENQIAELAALVQAGAALQEALVAWRDTYSDLDAPDLSDHFYHSRGLFKDDCPGCVAEMKLMLMADKLDRAARAPSAGTDLATERASSSSTISAVPEPCPDGSSYSP